MAANQKSPDEILHQAIKITEPTEQKIFLDRACKGNESLRAEVESLLKAYAESGDFLEIPAIDPNITVLMTPLTEKPGTVIGRYKLLEKIGEGGMAVVYMTEQNEPIRRKVALKIIKLGMDTRQVIARFEAERQVLAMMDHPNIAKVLDAGATETGRPYFVMELVKGASITEYCDKNRLNTRQRLELFIQVCNAVQHAHQKGIIHRDIKPTNVMVTYHDGKPVPKIIDFGIAKAINQKLTEKTLFTRYAQIIGTPAYMSPEQAELSDLDIDTRTDIYSLGVLLYELLTGTTPFSKEELCNAGFIEMQRIIREQEPPKPSTKLSTLGRILTDIAKYRNSTPDLLTKSIRGDLDWIVMKSLEKDRNQRYATPNELGMDVERYLSNRPVSAGAPRRLYRLQKFVRRHRITLTASLLIVAALVTGFVTTSIMWLRAEGERKRTAVALAQSRYWLYVSNIRVAKDVIAHPVSATARDYLDHCPEEFRDWEWRRLNWLADRSIRTFLEGDLVRFVTFSPDGRRILSISSSSGNPTQCIKMWSAETGEELLTLGGHGIRCGALSPDGRRIISCDEQKHMKMYDAATGVELLRFETVSGGGGISSLTFSPDGTRIVAVSCSMWGHRGEDVLRRYDPIRMFDAASGKVIMTLAGHGAPVASAVFSPDGQRIASGSVDKTIKVWDANTGAELMTLRGHESEVTSVAYSPDAQRIVSGSKDKTVRVWDAQTGSELFVLRGHGSEVSSVAFSPNSERIMSSSYDTTVRLWDAATGQEQMVLLGHGRGVCSATFSPDGRYVVSGGEDGVIKLWDVELLEEPMILRWDESPAMSLAFSPNSRLLVSGRGDGTIRIWNADTGEAAMTLRGHENAVSSVAFSPDGESIVSGSLDRTIRLWNVDTGEELMKLENEDIITSVAFSPDGKRIVSGGWEKIIRIWDAATGKELAHFAGHEECISSVAFSPDGERIFSCSEKNIKAWDTQTGEEIISIPRYGAEKTWQPGFAISRDGKRIVSGVFDGTHKSAIRLWDATTGEELPTFGGSEGRFACSFAFSSDGKRIVTGGLGEITIWDTATGEGLMNLGGHEGVILCVAFSPSGRYIASADESSTIRIWSCGPHENR